MTSSRKIRNHLVLRGSTWHCRLDIPKDLRPLFEGKRILARSLKTGNKHVAEDKGRQKVAKWKEGFEKLRSILAEGPGWQEGVAAKAAELKKDGEVILLGTLKDESSSNRDRTPADSNDMDELFAIIEGQLNSLFEVDMKHGTNFQRHYAEMTKANLKGETSTAEYLQRFFNMQEEVHSYRVKERFHLNELQRQEAFSIISSPEDFKPKSPITPAMLDSWSKHLVGQLKNQKVRDSQISKVKRLSSWLSEKRKKLDFDSVDVFIREVSSARETRSKYLSAGRAFWKWAKKYNSRFRESYAGKPCPFDGHDLPRVGKEAGESYEGFTVAEANILYAKASTKKDKSLAYLIAFGAYTGARLEEIGRITKGTTVIDDSGIPIAFKGLPQIEWVD